MNWESISDTHFLFVNIDEGRVCGEVDARINQAGYTLWHAKVNGKFIGKYLHAEDAKNAVEENQPENDNHEPR
ncbi:MAG: hypothetical protein NUV80_06510 [Candidatus Berkelbacteria bacterium]|nr:hypothetical protein [Candidatus Berkelbacteria bacterium]